MTGRTRAPGVAPFGDPSRLPGTGRGVTGRAIGIVLVGTLACAIAPARVTASTGGTVTFAADGSMCAVGSAVTGELAGPRGTGDVQSPMRPRLQAATARVRVLRDSDTATVVLLYALTLAEPTRELRVRAIPFFGLAPDSVRAMVDGVSAAVRLETGEGGALEGRVVASAEAPAQMMFALELRYRVPGAVSRRGKRVDIRAPVLLVDAAPASSADGFFDARLLAPAGTTVTGSFPSVHRVRETSADGEQYAMALQVVPSLLRWHAAEGPASWLSFEAGVDAGVLLVLTLLIAAGARALARSA